MASAREVVPPRAESRISWRCQRLSSVKVTCSRRLATAAQRTSLPTLFDEFAHKREVRSHEWCFALSQLVLDLAVQSFQVVPGDTGKEMVLKMVVLVAHEELSDAICQNRSRPPNRIIWLLEERVLAHSSDIHHGVDHDHGLTNYDKIDH